MFSVDCGRSSMQMPSTVTIRSADADFHFLPLLFFSARLTRREESEVEKELGHRLFEEKKCRNVKESALIDEPLDN